MTTKPHDQFAKQYLEELLFPFGNVKISQEVTDEIRQIDIVFSPSGSAKAGLQSLGLLGKIAENAVLIEPFRNQPSKSEVRSCLQKLFTYYGYLERQAKREEKSLPEDELPYLWILATHASDRLVTGFGGRLDLASNEPGIYKLPEFLRTSFVAINRLPKTEETLWLRILGKGRTQSQAIGELLKLPRNHPLRHKVQQLIADWRITKVNQQKLSPEEKEFMRNISEAYLEWEEATRQQGRQQGRQEGRQEGKIEERRQLVENLLRVRFGSLDAELSKVVEPLLELPPEELSRLLLELSRQELLARFADNSN